MNTDIEALKLVYELNDRTLDSGHTGPLEFESSGFCSCVTLYGHTVWDDSEYQAPWDEIGDEQMPLRDWFLKRIAEIQQVAAKDLELLLRTETPAPEGTRGASKEPTDLGRSILFHPEDPGAEPEPQP